MDGSEFHVVNIPVTLSRDEHASEEADQGCPPPSCVCTDPTTTDVEYPGRDSAAGTIRHHFVEIPSSFAVNSDVPS